MIFKTRYKLTIPHIAFMKKLSEEKFRKAEQFILTEARKIEQKLYYYHFKPITSSQQEVITELTTFQNFDRGFGNALEPDVRMKESSVVSTKFALQTLMDIGAPSLEKLVKDGIAYLLEQYDRKTKTWALVGKDVSNAPHAPWWEYENLLTEFNYYLANPKAGILKILLHYEDLVPKNIISEVSDSLFSYLEELPVNMPFFDANGFLQLMQAEKLSKSTREKLLHKMKETVLALVSLNPKEWQDFSIKPFWLVPSPESPFYELLKPHVHLNLNFEIDNQQDDGAWLPTWTWEGKWDDYWETAKKEWKGIMTLATLRSLKDFNLIEGISVSSPDTHFKYPMD